MGKKIYVIILSVLIASIVGYLLDEVAMEMTTQIIIVGITGIFLANIWIKTFDKR